MLENKMLREDSEQKESLGEQMSTQEALLAIESQEDPGISLLRKARLDALQTYAAAEKQRKEFLADKGNMGKGEYIRAERSVFKQLAQQKKACTELYAMYDEYVGEMTADLTTHYSNLLRLKSKKGISQSEKKRCDDGIREAKRLIDEYKGFLAEARILRDIAKGLEGRTFERKWQMVQKDPYKRYDKKEKKRAKKYAEEGRERSWKNAAKYFSSGPITEKDAGKCGITDDHIQKNKEAMEQMIQKTKENSEKRAEKIYKDVSFEYGIDLPNFGEQLEGLLKKYEGIIDSGEEG